MRLLFISHLFPDGRDPSRGLDNVALLNALADRWDVRAVVLRPTGIFERGEIWHPRAADVAFLPEFVEVPTLPILGAGWNAGRAARALRKPLDRLRRDWRFDVVLCGSLLPDACAAARLASEFQFRFVALSIRDEAEPRLRRGGVRRLVASSLSRAVGVVTDSNALSAVLSRTGFRKERLTLVSSSAGAAEACHRLLLPVRG